MNKVSVGIKQIPVLFLRTLMVLFVTSFSLVLGAAPKKPPAPELTLEAQMALPFRDNAVLQQGISVPVWGTTFPGSNVTVKFNAQSKTTLADKNGKWRVLLDRMVAVKLKSVNDDPVGMEMTITCEKDGKKAVKTLQNLIVGDVWICAGQSNMAGTMRRAVHEKNYPADSIPKARYPSLRLYSFKDDSWLVCSPETAIKFSRVSFNFIRRVQHDALIPMGIITTAVGGSKIESWLNQAPYSIGSNYKRLLQPHVGFGIRGAIWYQGESNETDGRNYYPKLKSLITGWREAWGQGQFPLHFVQLPGIKSSSPGNPAMGDGRAEIRQAYTQALSEKNTGMAVTIDIGTPGEHPPNKYDSGVRLARSVLQKVYGFNKVTACPLYKDYKVEGNSIRVSFNRDAGKGLMIAQKGNPNTLPDTFLPPKPMPNAKLKWLSIKDKNGSWHWAESKIEGSELIVSAPAVKEPIAVRYAYTTQPYGPLLYNTDGMPVGPFSTCGYDPISKK